MNKKIILWLFFVIICSTIFALSHQPATVSGNMSKNITAKILESTKETQNLSKRKKIQVFYKKDTLIRDYAHFMLSFSLGISAFLLTKSYKLRHSSLLSLIFCTLYALSDEYHQTFIPGRSFQMEDLYLDLLGSIVGIALTLLAFKIAIIHNNRKKKITYE